MTGRGDQSGYPEWVTGGVKEVVAKKGCWRGLSEGIAGGGDQRG